MPGASDRSDEKPRTDELREGLDEPVLGSDDFPSAGAPGDTIREEPPYGQSQHGQHHGGLEGGPGGLEGDENAPPPSGLDRTGPRGTPVEGAP